MIIYKNDKSLAGRYRKRHIRHWQSVQEIYKGARLVWAAIRSCFGAGFWVNEKPWLNNEGWKNN